MYDRVAVTVRGLLANAQCEVGGPRNYLTATIEATSEAVRNEVAAHARRG